MVHIAPLLPKRMHSAQHIAQVAQRFRNETDLPINLYHNFPRAGSMPITDRNWFAEKQREKAKAHIRDLRKTLRLDPEESPPDGQKRMIKTELRDGNVEADSDAGLNLIRPDLTMNEYQIHHNIYKLERDNIYKKKSYMKSWLERYGLTIEGRVDCPLKLPEAETLTSTAESADVEKVDKDEFEDRIDEHLGKDIIRRTDEVAAKILFLKRYYRKKEDIRKIVLEHGTNGRKWNKLRRQIHAQAPRTDLREKQRNILLGAFEIGEELTSEEICSRLQELSLPLLDTSELSTNEAIDRMRRHFKLKRTSAMRGGDRTNVYRIESTDPLPVPLSERVKKPKLGEDSFRIIPSFL